MNPPSADKSPLQRLLDAGVYAPLGYVLRRDEVRQDLAAAGRKQVAFARSLGRAALKTVGRGVRPKDTAPAPAAKPASRSQSSDPAPEAAEPQAAPAEAAEQAESVAAVEPTTPVDTPEAVPEVEGAAVVDGYAEMTAKEIIARMADATIDEARWILQRETAGKNRVTVIRSAHARIDRND